MPANLLDPGNERIRDIIGLPESLLSLNTFGLIDAVSDFEIQKDGTAIFKIDTSGNIDTLDSNITIGTGLLNFEDSYFIHFEEGTPDRLEIHAAASTLVQLAVGTNIYNFGAGIADWGFKDLFHVGKISFDVSPLTTNAIFIDSTGDDIRLNARSGGSILLDINGNPRYTFNLTTADFQGRNLSTVGYIDLAQIEPPSNPINAGRLYVTDLGSVIITFGAIGGTNSGYTNGESITLSGGAGAGATATALITGGIIQSVTLVLGGLGYNVGDSLIITGVTSGIATATILVSTITTSDTTLFLRDDDSNVTSFLPLSGGTLTGDLVMGLNEIQFNDVDTKIFQSVDDLILQVNGANDIFFFLNGANHFQFDQSGMALLGSGTRKIVGVVEIDFKASVNNILETDSNNTMRINANRSVELSFDSTNSGVVTFLDFNSKEYEFSNTEADWMGNNLTGMGILEFESDVTIQSSTPDLEIDVPDGGKIIFNEDKNLAYSFEDGEANFQGNDLKGVGAFSTIGPVAITNTLDIAILQFKFQDPTPAIGNIGAIDFIGENSVSTPHTFAGFLVEKTAQVSPGLSATLKIEIAQDSSTATPFMDLVGAISGVRSTLALQADVRLGLRNFADDDNLIISTSGDTDNNLLYQGDRVKTGTATTTVIKPSDQLIQAEDVPIDNMSLLLSDEPDGLALVTVFLLLLPTVNNQSVTFVIGDDILGELARRTVNIGDASEPATSITFTFSHILDGAIITITTEGGGTADFTVRGGGTLDTNASAMSSFEVF